jgi:DedD protein
MRLPFMKPKTALPPAAPVAAAADVDDIEATRLRARRRLVGALVLLIAGVIAFPLVFETQPRPIGAQTAVEPGAREVVAAVPAAATRPKPAEVAPVAPPPDAGIETAPATPMPAPVAAPVAPPVMAPTPPPVPAATAAPTPKAASAPAAVAAAVAAAVPAPAPTPPADGARAKALLEGTPSDSAAVPGSGRFIVQVGAYASLAPMKEVRVKVEKLGMKTYTQVIENADGKRTRLRVGPFGTRAEAEAAAAKLKAAGLPGNLLAL